MENVGKKIITDFLDFNGPKNFDAIFQQCDTFMPGSPTADDVRDVLNDLMLADKVFSDADGGIFSCKEEDFEADDSE